MTASIEAVFSDGRKNDLASFIAAHVRAALRTTPGLPVDERLIAGAIAKFESESDAGTEPHRVAVFTHAEEADLRQATEVLASAANQAVAHLPDQAKGTSAVELMTANPSLAVASIITANKELRVELHNSNFIDDMHQELVQTIRDLLPLLQQTSDSQNQVEAALRLLDRVDGRPVGIPKSITPHHMLRTVERLFEVSEGALRRFHGQMDRRDVERSLVAVNDALHLLEQIHGATPAPVDNDEEIEDGGSEPGNHG